MSAEVVAETNSVGASSSHEARSGDQLPNSTPTHDAARMADQPSAIDSPSSRVEDDAPKDIERVVDEKHPEDLPSVHKSAPQIPSTMENTPPLAQPKSDPSTNESKDEVVVQNGVDDGAPFTVLPRPFVPEKPPPEQQTRVTNKLKWVKTSLLKTLSAHKDSWPFKHPVDSMKMKLRYYEVIKNPMDLQTINRRLTNKFYNNVQECLDDFELLFKNCYTFNPEGHPINIMGHTLEDAFRVKMRDMPPGEEYEIVTQKLARGVSRMDSRISRANSTSTDAPQTPPPAPIGIAPTLSTPVLTAAERRNTGAPNTPTATVQQASPVDRSQFVSAESIAQRRESRTVKPPKRVEEEMASSAARSRPSVSSVSSPAPPLKKAKLNDQMRFCKNILNDLMSKKYHSISHIFWQPVDPVKLGIPDYTDFVKLPMDFSTVKQRLEAGEYRSAKYFADDMRLCFFNCYRYNRAGDDVNEMGHKCQAAFEQLFSSLPDYETLYAFERQPSRDIGTSPMSPARAGPTSPSASVESVPSSAKKPRNRTKKDKVEDSSLTKQTATKITEEPLQDLQERLKEIESTMKSMKQMQETTPPVSRQPAAPPPKAISTATPRAPPGRKPSAVKRPPAVVEQTQSPKKQKTKQHPTVSSDSSSHSKGSSRKQSAAVSQFGFDVLEKLRTRLIKLGGSAMQRVGIIISNSEGLQNKTGELEVDFTEMKPETIQSVIEFVTKQENKEADKQRQQKRPEPGPSRLSASSDSDDSDESDGQPGPVRRMLTSSRASGAGSKPGPSPSIASNRLQNVNKWKSSTFQPSPAMQSGNRGSTRPIQPSSSSVGLPTLPSPTMPRSSRPLGHSSNLAPTGIDRERGTSIPRSDSSYPGTPDQGGTNSADIERMRREEKERRERQANQVNLNPDVGH